MTCCIEKSSIFAACFWKMHLLKFPIFSIILIKKNMNYSCRKTIVPIYNRNHYFQAPARTMNQPGEKAINKLIQWY